jgi:hypothetical protein
MVKKRKKNEKGAPKGVPSDTQKGTSEGNEACEVFEVEHDGKTEEKTACGVVPGKRASKKDLKNQDKILKGFIIFIAVVAMFFLLWWLISYSVRYFEYQNMEFEVVKEGDIIFYKTSLPVEYQGNVIPYNFYLRRDPRKVGNLLDLEEKMVFRKNLVFDLKTENLYCEGDWNIAIGNLVSMFNLFGISTLIYNESEEYLPAEDYLNIVFDEGEETEIIKVNELNYELNVADCDILSVTEKLMVEAIKQFKELNAQE